jgi:hypothetical protein
MIKAEIFRFIIYALIFSAVHGAMHNFRTPPRRPPVRTYRCARIIKRINDHGEFA